MTQMNVFKGADKTLKRDIVPKESNNPNGIENNSVNENINRVTPNPFSKFRFT